MELAIDPAVLVGFCLALVRTTAFVVICPPFNMPAIPVKVRTGIAVAISIAITGRVTPGTVGLDTASFVSALFAQAIAGLALGIFVMVLFSAIQSAGELIDLQVGFSLGSVLDPLSGNTAAPIGRLHQILGLAIVFAVNGHILVVRGFLRSIDAVPVGGIDLGRLAEELSSLLTVLLAASIEIALPILTALFCIEVALGLLGKAAPQMNILVLGFAVKAMAAFALLATTIVLLPESTQSLLERAMRSAGRVFTG
ncbi:MAG: flagellar biosynthetic protein FliR [Acidimicrobiia bacterium]